MTAADRRATAAKFSATAADDDPRARPAPTARVKPVRHTVDLAPARHRALDVWRAETAAELGVVRVTSQRVLAVLVARLLTDETLARKIRADLAEQAET